MFSIVHRDLRTTRAVVLTLFTVLPLWASAIHAESDDRDRVQIDRVEQYIAAFASGEPTRYEAWLVAHRTPSALAAGSMVSRLAQYEQDFAQWGTMRLHRLQRQSPSRVDATVETRAGEPMVLEFRFEPEAPWRVDTLHIRMGGPPQLEVELPHDWSHVQELADVRAATGIPAVALGVIHGGSKQTAIAGVRVAGEGDPAQINDAFHWGSVGKSVTGTVLGALMEQGKLSPDDTLSQLLPDIAMHEGFRDVTLWQLMGHQAGLAPYTTFDEDFFERIKGFPGSSETDKRRGLVKEMLAGPPVFTPGSAANYSNAGPTVAGYIAEALTDKSWRELVGEYVFAPADMSHGGFGWPVSRQDPDGVRGHFEPQPGNFEPRPLGEYLMDPDVIAPAGGLHSSIDDLLRYGAMHLAGMRGENGLLKASTMRLLHEPRPQQKPHFGGEHYTFGWGHLCPIQLPEDATCQGHNGGGGTFFAEIVIVPEYDLVIAFMASSMLTGQAVAGAVLEALAAPYL